MPLKLTQSIKLDNSQRVKKIPDTISKLKTKIKSWWFNLIHRKAKPKGGVENKRNSFLSFKRNRSHLNPNKHGTTIESNKFGNDFFIINNLSKGPESLLGNGVKSDSVAVITEYISLWKELQESLISKEVEKSLRGHEGVIFITDIRPIKKKYTPNCDFYFIRKLGSGSQGTVYLAQDAYNNKKFAVKKTGLRCFNGDELELTCKLWHENVIKIYGVIRFENNLYILMEYMDGLSANTFIKSINSLEEYQALYYAYEIFSALDYFQSVGIIHGDIKASNVMVSSDGLRLVVIDLGLARRIPHGQSTICNHGILTGTPTHWSPEIARNESYDYRSDVWAAMCFLVHLLTGSHPWIKRCKEIEALQYFVGVCVTPRSQITLRRWWTFPLTCRRS